MHISAADGIDGTCITFYVKRSLPVTVKKNNIWVLIFLKGCDIIIVAVMRPQ